MPENVTHRDLVTRSGLRAFRAPQSVAVIGASNDHAKWGYWLARGAIAGASTRDVWLVNRTAAKVQGRPAFDNLTSLPGTPELVVVCVPASQVSAVIEESLGLGVRAFLVITAGVAIDQELRARLHAAGARMVGPNSLGIYDAANSLQLAWGHFTPGSLAVVSQSGQLGSEIANLAARGGLGISRFVSIGNQADVTAAELLDDLVDHETTEVVAVYLESFADAEQLVGVLHRLRQAGKPTIVLAAGGSEGSKRLAASHTGSMTSTHDVVDAVCRAAGAVRVRTPVELVELARYLTVAQNPVGRRVAIVSDSGGQGGVAADVAAAIGLSTPVFSPPLQASLAAVLPTGAATVNPIDLAGAGEADLQTYAEICERLVASGEVDAVILSGYLGCYGEDSPLLEAAECAVVDRLGNLVRHREVPLVVHSMSAGSRAVRRMWTHGIPAFESVEPALNAVKHAHHLQSHRGRATALVSPRDLHVGPGYWSARRTLSDLGVPVAAAALVSDVGDVRATAGQLQAPYVLKAGWLEHKSEHGGVVLGLRDADSLETALSHMRARLGPGEYVVEEQDSRRDVVEVIVGARRDPDAGPTISVGAGGVEAELWKDVRVELAPVDRATAREMVDGLRIRALLEGWRGRPAVDVDALVDVIVTVSEAICADPTITELELNPVRVAPTGVLVVDALITCTDLPGDHASADLCLLQDATP